jgi:hypothetical protein
MIEEEAGFGVQEKKVLGFNGSRFNGLLIFPKIVPSCRTRSGILKANGLRLPPEGRLPAKPSFLSSALFGSDESGGYQPLIFFHEPRTLNPIC